MKKLLAANLETIAKKVTPNLEPNQREDFHEFLRAYTDIFSKNIYESKDYTYY